MSSRLPACESPGIAERLAEIQAERIRMIAGCHCPRDALGAATHNTLCPLRPEPASQMALALEAMQRARARLRQVGVPIREIKGAAGPLLILPTDAKLSDRDIAELRALWVKQTAGPGPAERADEITDRIPWLGRWGSGDSDTSPLVGLGAALTWAGCPTPPGRPTRPRWRDLNE